MENEIQGLYNTNPKQHITIYDEIFKINSYLLCVSIMDHNDPNN